MSLPPNQQHVAAGKWPLVGERTPRDDEAPWSVAIRGLVERERVWSLDDLWGSAAWVRRAVDIHCVTRWSRLGMEFGGVPLRTLLEDCSPRPAAQFVSFVARSERGHSTSLMLDELLQLDALIALEAEGAPLSVEHGGPVRMVVPGRYFYKSVKWLEAIELLERDRLGYWEAEAGYHNHADPWREERYAAPTLGRREALELFARRDFSGRDLRGLEGDGRELMGLVARGSLLRDARLRGADLRDACFDGANLSNAHLEGADLRGATFRSWEGRAADLEGADFRGADLRGAIFEGASLFGATLTAVDEQDRSPSARLDGTSRLDEATLETLAATPRQLDFVRRELNPADGA